MGSWHGHHHFLLCFKGGAREDADAVDETAGSSGTGDGSAVTGQGSPDVGSDGVSCISVKGESRNVVYQVVEVAVKGSNGIVHANVGFDSFCDRVYARSGFIKEVGPEFVGVVSHFG